MPKARKIGLAFVILAVAIVLLLAILASFGVVPQLSKAPGWMRTLLGIAAILGLVGGSLNMPQRNGPQI